MKMILIDGERLGEFNLVEGNEYNVIDSNHKSLYSVYINNGETIYLAKSRFKQYIGENECLK